jgi:apolipoprotein N-acyltransferase
MFLSYLNKKFLRFFILFSCSFGIVAFGQPGWIHFLAPFATVFGYALFWKSLDFFSSRGQRFWISTAWFAFVQMIQLSWMTATEYQGIYILFVYAALAFGLGLQFGVVSLLIPNGKISLPRVLAISSLWTVLEWARLYFLCGFSWNPVGMALTGCIPSLQLAAIWGVFGLSFVVMLSNLLTLKYLFFERKTHHYLIWGGVALFPYLFGWLHIAIHHQDLKKETFSAALVQTSLLPSEKIPLYGKSHMFISPYDQWHQILSFLKEQDQKKIDLIVLPEAAVPFTADQFLYSHEIVEKILCFELGEDALLLQPPLQPPFAKIKYVQGKDIWTVTNAFWAQFVANYFNTEVVAGMDVRDVNPDNSIKNYNAALYFTPFSENVKNRYEKRILLPLAEYLPFDFLRPLVERYGISEFFTHGKEAKVFNGQVPFSVSICYEETFANLIREGRLKGAKLFVNVTNDNWYPFSRLPQQHFEHGRLRAVENGVPMVRSCNMGLTVAIDCFGRIVASLGKDSGVLFTQLSKHHFKTLYTFWGDFGIISLCVLFLVLFLGLKQRFNW